MRPAAKGGHDSDPLVPRLPLPKPLQKVVRFRRSLRRHRRLVQTISVQTISNTVSDRPEQKVRQQNAAELSIVNMSEYGSNRS